MQFSTKTWLVMALVALSVMALGVGLAQESDDEVTIIRFDNPENYLSPDGASFCAGPQEGFLDERLIIGRPAIALEDGGTIYAAPSTDAEQLGSMSGDVAVLDGPYCNTSGEQSNRWYYVHERRGERLTGWLLASDGTNYLAVPEINVAPTFGVQILVPEETQDDDGNSIFTASTEEQSLPADTSLIVRFAEPESSQISIVGTTGLDDTDTVIENEDLTDFEILAEGIFTIEGVNANNSPLVIIYQLPEGNRIEAGGASALPEVAPIETEADVVLEYTQNGLTLYNNAGQNISVSDLVFTGEAGAWEGNLWAEVIPENVLLIDFDAGDCLQVYDFNAPQPPAPPFCGNVEGFVATGREIDFFWQGEFTVTKEGVELAVCAPAPGRCSFDVPE